MANRIKGITIEIGGDTTGLDKALKGVNSAISKTQSALNDVNRLLKLDPTNTVLVAQKQELLSKAIEQTEEKLSALESVQEQVSEAFRRGELGEDKYRAFQREVEETRGKLNKYKGDLADLQSEQNKLSTNTERLDKIFTATGTSVDDYADVLGDQLVRAIKNGSASSDDLKNAIEKIGKALTDGRADLKQFIAALDTVDDGTALQNLIQQLRDAGTAADSTSDKLDDLGNTAKGSALMQAADQLSAVGDKLEELGGKAMDAFSETERAISKVTAYFGETGEEAERSGQIIQDVYEKGVGDSLESVADALILVKRNLGDLNDTDLSNLTQQALRLDELYGIDMNETLRGVNSLMVQFGLTAQEAMDYIVVGTQNGLDKTNELGDNLSEYAGKFAQAGYSASEYFQLLNNGLDNGAYNLDKVNDAINEVTTRLVDGTVGDAIGSFSEQTQAFFAAWQNGEATQKQVIDSIVSDIANCTNQQEALNLAATAFGTMAEDGSLKFITALTSMGDAYDDVSDAANGMFDQTLTSTEELESNTRKVQQALVPLGERITSLANTVLPPLTAAIQTVSEWFSSMPEPIQNFVVILGVLLAAFTALTPVIAAVAVSVSALNISLLPVIGVIAAVAAAIAAIIAIVQNWNTIVQVAQQVFQTVVDAIGQAIEGLKSFFTGLWQHIQSVWDTICNVVQTAVMQIASILEAAVQIITLPFQFIWENCKDIIIGAWDTITGAVTAALETVGNIITTVLTTIQNFIASVWAAIYERVSTVLNTIYTVVSTVFNAVKSVVTTIWNGIKTAITTVVDGIRNTVSSVFNSVKDTVSSVFNNIKNTATTVWNNIKNAITQPIEKARDTVKGIVDSIVGFFSGMKIEFPKIKLPHFSITGSFSLAPPSVPKLSIDWYKEGGIMTSPTFFGMNGTSLMAGGEAGAEAILPLNGFYDRLEQILSSRLNTTAMEQYLSVIAANSGKGIYLDDGTLVGRLLPSIDSGLADYSIRSGRGNR